MLTRLCVVILLFIVTGCIQSTPPRQPNEIHSLSLPANWQQDRQISIDNTKIKSDWLTDFVALSDGQLNELVDQALHHNPSMQQQHADLLIKQQQLQQAKALFWPRLDGQLDATRRSTQNADSFTQAVAVSYELDVWNKLQDSHKRANLAFLAARQIYRQQRQELVANVVTVWFQLIAEWQLLAVSEKRLATSQQNLQIIESGYRQGIYSALDVYLTRNELHNESSQLAQQRATVLALQRQLSQLTGDYPHADRQVIVNLPLLDDDIQSGVPSVLLTRQPQILAAWYQLLSQHAALAFAHKQRYPRITIGANLGLGGDQVQSWLNGDFIWSLLAGVSGTIFDAGDLAAQEQISALELEQAEQQYIEVVLDTIAKVENGIDQELALKRQFAAITQSDHNASAAMTLAFEQYQSGLVSLTTVLDAQNRAFSAQSAVITLKNQLLANRIALYVALGSDFSSIVNNDMNRLKDSK